MQRLIALTLLLFAGVLLAGCSSSQVRDSVMSIADSAVRSNCERAGNCEVHCKSDTTIKTHEGQCVGE